MSSVLDLLSPYLGSPSGSPSSGNVKYRCPFHKGGAESSPSFYTNVESGVSFCHACNKGWSLLSVLNMLGASTFHKDVAARIIKLNYGEVGIDRPINNPPLTEGVMAIVGQWCPSDLIDAGFDKDILKEHEVGFDPHHEVPVYPIRDHAGRLMALSGRWWNHYNFYDEDKLKALICADNFRYTAPRKSQFLWGLHKIYPELKNAVADTLVVVEGFKANLWVVQSGYRHVVSLMGSYLSEHQARLIERLASRVIMLLDWDRAGRDGTAHAVERLSGSCIVDVAVYPTKDLGTKVQPDDIDPAVLMQMIEGAQPYWRKR